jgi:lipopolysaccharide transport system ATP-binding protein
MSDVVIQVENLSKKYIIGHQKQERYSSFRDVIANGARSIWQGLSSDRKVTLDDRSEEFWALKDVSFEIKQGDRVGIIGRNGAGKSTLLKILSRITEPTSGKISIKGRVASLLEVGTGFHPELTGRENIYLNGAILGMDRSEIKKKFDEIVAFAEVEKFLDTPVKRYSSGMYVRLAFAVAAHLEPEILIVDEVLAVGDAQFQKKCLGKLEDVGKEGRTVLFVSHNIGAILSLTQKCLFLEKGYLVFNGSSEESTERYLTTGYSSGRLWRNPIRRNTPIRIIECMILDENGAIDGELDVRRDFIVETIYEVCNAVQGANISLNVHGSDGSHIMSLEDCDQDNGLLEYRQQGIYKTQVRIPGLWLNNGRYILRVGTGITGVELYENVEALIFNLVETGDVNTRGHRKGYLLPMLPWQTTKIELVSIGS